ncbi:hypothetical protein DAEQUDRAFT_757084 [Daedalea quercina L-15889]|uniref:BTB domain-containing protein n=1 Tax=Daedalea quercina L-15889 TaxID=1314783 RepID=A0A165QDR5_9APHY|nr:hypothetical protein DAEQUDRAFT_757084 [Daedalea quercina L-15889]
MSTPTSPRATSGDPKIAPALFNRPDADTILCSPDNTHFRVHRQILSIASPIFETMFSLPQPPPTSLPETLPLVEVEEDARTLEDLLRIFYPVRDPQLTIYLFTDWQHISSVTRAALKYEIVQAVEFMKARLTAGVECSPLEVFCMACKHGLESIAKIAAVRLAAPGNQGVLEAYVPQLEDIPAGCYHRLIQAVDRQISSADEVNFCPQGDKSAHATGRQEPSAYYRVRDPDDASLSENGIRTTDNVYYNLPEDTFLTLQSPHLIAAEELSTAPKDEGVATSAVVNSPVLALPEDSKTLELLLRTEREDPDELVVIACGLRAAANYEMLRVRDTLAKRWRAISAEDPLQAYLLASAHGLKAESIAAAKHILSWNTKKLRAAFIPAMEHVSAGHYFRLLRYHQHCVAAAEDALGKSWAAAFPPAILMSCPSGGLGCGHPRSRWANACFARLQALRDCPRKVVENDTSLVGELCFQAASCSRCATSVSPTDIIAILTNFTHANEEIIKGVDTNLLFKTHG